VPLAAVVVVLTTFQVPDGSSLLSVMVLPGRAVPLAVRVPERVKGWLAAGLVVEGVMVMVVGARVPIVRVSKPVAGAWMVSPPKD